MGCDDVTIALSARAHDEEADDPDVLAHLEDCPDCQAFERDLAPVRDLWQRAREDEIDLAPGAWGRLRDRITAEPAPRRRSLAILLIPTIAAVALILVFGFLLQPVMDEGLAVTMRYGELAQGGRPVDAGRPFRLQRDVAVRNVGGGPARMDAEDATVILAPGAALAWRAPGVLSLEEGAALVRTGRPLRLETDACRIEVHGTEFIAERSGGGLGVLVLHGRVTLGGETGAVVVGAGSRSYCEENGTPTPPAPASPWSSLAWLGTPSISFRSLPDTPDDGIELEILVETTSPEVLPIRPFAQGFADFLLEIVDPAGDTYPLKILPAMIVSQNEPPGHRTTYPLARGRPYRLHLRLHPEDLGREAGVYEVRASYNVRAPADARVWQGRLKSDPTLLRR